MSNSFYTYLYDDDSEDKESYSDVLYRYMVETLHQKKENVFKEFVQGMKETGSLDSAYVRQNVMEKHSFYRQNVRPQKVSDALEGLGPTSVPAYVLILAGNDANDSNTRKYAFMLRWNGNFISNSPYASRDVFEMYIRWDDEQDHSPFPIFDVITYTPYNKKKTTKKRAKKGSVYQYYQPNPQNKRTDDCVPRALSLVLGISWSDAVDVLASFGEMPFNTRPVIAKAMRGRGFTHHEALGEDITGNEFCQLLNENGYHGTVLAMVDNNHAAAVMPDEKGNYHIYDAWDCSSNCFKDFWILQKEDLIC